MIGSFEIVKNKHCVKLDADEYKALRMILKELDSYILRDHGYKVTKTYTAPPTTLEITAKLYRDSDVDLD